MLQFLLLFSVLFFIFFFQASESSGLAATQSHAMPHFEAAVWHSPVHNNQDVFEVRLPVLSSLVLFAHDIPSNVPVRPALSHILVQCKTI